MPKLWNAIALFLFLSFITIIAYGYGYYSRGKTIEPRFFEPTSAEQGLPGKVQIKTDIEASIITSCLCFAYQECEYGGPPSEGLIDLWIDPEYGTRKRIQFYNFPYQFESSIRFEGINHCYKFSENDQIFLFLERRSRNIFHVLLRSDS